MLKCYDRRGYVMNEEYYKKCLTSSEVNERIEKNLVNYDDVPPTKTIPRILRDNFFTYFNFIIQLVHR